ncbi:hypothetical protein M0R45_029099 [Rubus argutus]|uniref:Copper transport protein n=1 Tax=Rubus argutus TaxID=59490 RepID=A0AAW1W6Z0_RUBAR
MSLYSSPAGPATTTSACMSCLSPPLPPRRRRRGSVLGAYPEADCHSSSLGGHSDGCLRVRTVLAYLVMLSVMTFNVGVLIAVVAGHALGFFVVKVRALNQPTSRADSADPLKV